MRKSFSEKVANFCNQKAFRIVNKLYSAFCTIILLLVINFIPTLFPIMATLFIISSLSIEAARALSEFKFQKEELYNKNKTLYILLSDFNFVWGLLYLPIIFALIVLFYLQYISINVFVLVLLIVVIAFALVFLANAISKYFWKNHIIKN